MPRLIDADALKLTFCRECTLYPDKCLEKDGGECDWHSIYHIKYCAPTIDAVPVVRCAECRWHEDEQPGMVYCPATVGGWVENDWYCKGGERKDGDGDG